MIDLPGIVPASRIATDVDALQAARDLATSFRAQAGQRDRERRPPLAELDAFSASGLGALTVPVAHGGPKISHATLADVIAIISAADASLGQLPQNQLAFYSMLDYADAPAVKQWVYPKALEGYRFSSALAETHSPTTQDITARARRDGSDWIISGRKGYATAASFAHLFYSEERKSLAFFQIQA